MLPLLTSPDATFEEAYLALRQKEGRIFTVPQIRRLPKVSSSHVHAAEWRVRRKGLEAFLSYLKNCKNIQRILEVGCGNGWFAAGMARRFPEMQIVGCDKNLYELNQAREAFPDENLQFVYGDIFEDWPPTWQRYDVVVLPSSVQYFNDFKQLIHRLLTLAPEVHILDSPFYKEEELEAARQRSTHYYHALGMTEMADFYHHHSYQQLAPFEYEYLYRPSQGWRRRFGRSPFPWVKITMRKS